MQIEISGTLEQAISDAVVSGEFRSPEDYLKAAIRYFRLQRVNEELEKGYEDIENGNVLKVTDIGKFFEKLNREINEELGYSA